MARVAIALTCTAEQRAELMTLARGRTEEARLVERAKIVLACLEGKRNDAVGRELGVRPNTVGLWRKRFAAAGLAGLRDRVRPGKAPKYGADLRLRVLRQLELPPPKGSASWDGASVAAALGVLDDAVWRLLRKEGCSCADGARGASAPIGNLPPRPPISSVSTSIRRSMRWS
jgi:transposase